jgi:hypothetical protein
MQQQLEQQQWVVLQVQQGHWEGQVGQPCRP